MENRLQKQGHCEVNQLAPHLFAEPGYSLLNPPFFFGCAAISERTETAIFKMFIPKTISSIVFAW